MDNRMLAQPVCGRESTRRRRIGRATCSAHRCVCQELGRNGNQGRKTRSLRRERETETMVRAWGRTALPPLLILCLLHLQYSPLVFAQGALPFRLPTITS